MTDINKFAEHAVRKGAALLDRVSPDWWTAERVDLATLDIPSGSLCLIAQSFGNGYGYGTGMGRLEKLLRDAGIAYGEKFDLALTHGFCGAYYKVDSTEFPDIADVGKHAPGVVYVRAETFTAPWVKVISERRAAPPVSDPILDLITESE